MIRRLIKWWYLSCVAISLSACQSIPAYWGSGTQQRIEAEMVAVRDADSLKNSGIPKSITKALLPPINVGFFDGNEVDAETRFDLSVKNSNARDVFLGLVKDTPYSVVINKGVNAKISLNLKNVTLDEAFVAIRESYGYDYELKNKNYVIYGNSIRSRIFYVNYINVNRVGASTTNISSGGLTENTQNAKVSTTSTVDFWASFKDSLESIIGKEDGRGVVINPQSGLVVVTATNRELRLIENFIRDTHDAIGRQVILEAKILEVELKDGYQTGINWGQLVNSAGNLLSIGQIGGGSLTAIDAVSEIGGTISPDITSQAFPNTSTSAFGGIFSVALQGGNFGAFIEMIQSQGDVQVLSSPRVATVNNQKAVIKVGGDEFFITGITSGQSGTTSTGSDLDTGSKVEMEAFFSGIALDVTPQINKDGDIILHLHPTVSEVTQKNKNFIVDGKSFSLPMAASTVRESDNIVKAESGQIIVVGGLMKESTVEHKSMVPLLGNIPFIGNLFKHQKISRVKKELIVLVKPTVITQATAWGKEAKRSLDRFADLER